jgi:hypothetical protein
MVAAPQSVKELEVFLGYQLEVKRGWVMSHEMNVWWRGV